MNILRTRKLPLAFIIAVAVSSPSVYAFPAFGNLPDFVTLIEHQRQAAKLPVGTRVALACKKCQGRNIKTVDEKKAFLAWFDAKKTQKCDGCGGQMKLKRAPGTSGYTHVCSKCGDNSASVCAAPMKKGKS